MNAQAEKIFDRFLKTDFGKRLLAEADAEEIDAAKRKQTAAELAELRRTRPEVMGEITFANQEAQRAVDEAREAYEEAKATAGRISRKNFSVQWGHDQRIRELESIMLRTAPPALRADLEEAKRRLEVLRGQPVYGTNFPDIPEAMGLTENDRPKVSAVQERVKDLAIIEAEIKTIENKILGGE